MGGIHGVVLAGGISSRMGFPKALLPFGKSFFLHRIYESLVAAETVPVHIVINAGLHSCLKSQAKQFPHGDFVLNKEPARGQIHSLQLGLEATKKAGAEAAVVALVDQPAIAVDTITSLCEAHRSEPGNIYVARFEGQPGHPVLIPAALFDAFLSAAEGKTARDVMAEHAAAVRYVDTADPQVTADVDSPEDLARLRQSEDDVD